MILPKSNRLTPEQLAEVTQIVESFGARVQPIVGAVRTIYAIVGDERDEPMINRIEGQCTIDPKNPNFLCETAQAVKEAGANVLRGGVWKPRTNPYTFQGDTKSLD